VLLIGAVWLDEYLERIWRTPGLVFVPIMALIWTLAGVEITGVFVRRSIAASRAVTSAAVLLGLATSSFSKGDLAQVSGVAVVCTAAALVLLMSLVFYSRGHNVEGVVASSAATLLAFVYLGLMGGFLFVIRKDFDGWLVLGVLLVTKSYDIGAYFFGRAFGRHKLIPWLSPGKTWEGLFGGLAVSTLTGWLGAELGARWGVGFQQLQGWHGAAVGLLFGFVGQLGDLIASLLKRDAGMKDYSSALPGFGGVLDVLDSPLLVAPVAYWVLGALAAA